jgi:hypothetical protein
MNGREPDIAVKRPSAPVLLVTILALIGAGSLFVMVGPMGASIANNMRNVNGTNGVVMIGGRHLQVLSLILFGLCGSLLPIVPRLSRATSWSFGGLLLLASLLLLTLLLDVDRALPMLLGFYAISMVCALAIALLSLAGLRRTLFPGEGQGRLALRTDSVVITREQLEQGILPDICMISGQPTTNRQTFTIQYQPKWAEAASLGGYVLGGLPGVLMHMMTSHKIHIPCPICEQHTGDWHRRNLYASIGWFLIPLLAGYGVLLGNLHFRSGAEIAALAIPMGFVGLFLYLIPVIYMSWNVVHCEQNSDGTSTAGQISIRRVCTAFASEVRKRQASWKPRV